MHIFACEHLHDIKFVFTVTQIVHVLTKINVLCFKISVRSLCHAFIKDIQIHIRVSTNQLLF